LVLINTGRRLKEKYLDDAKEMTVGPGQVVVMLANVPHAVTAVNRFKMLLAVVK